MKRFVAVFDNHGDMVDAKALAAFREFVKHWKPEVRIHGGDCFDLRALRKGASKDEEFEDLAPDIEAGLDFLSWYKPTHFLRGNHDERLWDAASGKNPIAARFAALTIEEVMDALGGAKMYPYCKRNGVMRLGHLKVIHGYHSGVTAARQAAQVYGSVLLGHVHTVDQYSIPGVERRIGRSCGCLVKLDMPYNRAQANTLRQSHGWGYGFIYPSGDYQYFQAECVNHSWTFPTEVMSIKHGAKG